MEVLYLALFAIGIYALMTLCRRWADSFIMIAFAIGCAVNANIFTAHTSPIIAGPIIFGIDSILMTMFLHLVTVKYIHYPLKEFKLFVASSIVAIMLSAIIEFVATIIYAGYSLDALKALGNYFISCVATLFGIAISVPVVKLMKNKRISQYVIFPIGILIASVVNTIIYYALSALVLGSSFDNFGAIIAGSYIGKVFCILLGLLCYYISSIWGHKDMPNKFIDKAKQEIFDVEIAKESDINEWKNLVNKYRYYFPGLELEEAMSDYCNRVLRCMSEQRALCVRVENEIVGVCLFSTEHNMITFVLVDDRFRKQGIGKAMAKEAINRLDINQPIIVKTYIKTDYRADAAWNFYISLGFKEKEISQDDNHPVQVFELK